MFWRCVKFRLKNKEEVLKQVFRYLAFTTLWLSSATYADWFDIIKSEATDEQLHQLLYEMPKGGDLHLHISGSVFPEWWYEMAVAAEEDGYQYYTKIKINNCRPYGEDAFSGAPYHLMFRNINRHSFARLDECERGEYVPLRDLTVAQKEAWLDSLRLDKAFEGRDEFFEAHWQRLGDITANPDIGGELIVRNLQAFSDEGLIYIEPQVSPAGFKNQDGTPIDPLEMARIYDERLKQKDALETGMTWRFQIAFLRFVPEATEILKMAYQFVSMTDTYVAVNLVGREDDDKGYPLRFLDTFRELRRTHNNVRLSIHAGEVDEPNYHVRDTLLLGAERIGHGINLITDPDTMRLMRHGPYMVEINLISNLLLEYVDDYSRHPFPEYLRTGIPVALSTDDRGMWDSTITDEFFVAVKEFNLSWAEVKRLSENSLKYAFLPEEEKVRLLDIYRDRIGKFERRMAREGLSGLNKAPSPKRGFVCRRYELCPS